VDGELTPVETVSKGLEKKQLPGWGMFDIIVDPLDDTPMIAADTGRTSEWMAVWKQNDQGVWDSEVLPWHPDIGQDGYRAEVSFAHDTAGNVFLAYRQKTRINGADHSLSWVSRNSQGEWLKEGHGKKHTSDPRAIMTPHGVVVGTGTRRGVEVFERQADGNFALVHSLTDNEVADPEPGHIRGARPWVAYDTKKDEVYYCYSTQNGSSRSNDRFVEGGDCIYYTISKDGGKSWGSSTKLSNNHSGQGFPDCAAHNGSIMVVWPDMRGGEVHLRYSILGDLDPTEFIAEDTTAKPKLLYYVDFEDGTIGMGREALLAAGRTGGIIEVVDNPAIDFSNPSSKVGYSTIPVGYNGKRRSTRRAELQSPRYPTEDQYRVYQWSYYLSEDIFKGGGSFKSILLSQWKTSPCFRIGCKTGWSGGGGGIANDVKWENGENSTIFRYRSNPDCAKFVWDYPVGRWFHFQQEILWTKDRSKGYYKLWMDGELVFEANGVRTLSENFIPGKCDMFWAVGLYGTVNSLPEGKDTIGLYYDNIAIYDARNVEWMGAEIQFDEYRADSEETWQSIPSEAGSLGGSSPGRSTITSPATDADDRKAAPSLALTTEPLGPKQGETKSFKLGDGVELELVWIPGGTFQMGSHRSEEDRDDDEGPVHTVELDGFWMGKTEVTQAQYERITGSNPSSSKGSRNPVETVSWNKATAFCEKLSQKTGNHFTLPTEAQWEYACRAGSSARYCFGDSDSTLGDYAWYSSNSGHQTYPVGQKRTNRFGLYDMHGNVWEWCRDWYAEDYYSSSPRKNPENTTPGEDRVLRGGSRGYHKEFCRSAYRVWGSPSYTHSGFGFRVVSVSRR